MRPHLDPPLRGRRIKKGLERGKAGKRISNTRLPKLFFSVDGYFFILRLAEEGG
jgi:hypothetical protein